MSVLLIDLLSKVNYYKKRFLSIKLFRTENSNTLIYLNRKKYNGEKLV